VCVRVLSVFTAQHLPQPQPLPSGTMGGTVGASPLAARVGGRGGATAAAAMSATARWGNAEAGALLEVRMRFGSSVRLESTPSRRWLVLAHVVS
jgi:hypothetical protein